MEKNMKNLSENELDTAAGGDDLNKVEELCQKPGVRWLLGFALPGVPELMEEKEFTNELSSMNLDDTQGIKNLFNENGVPLSNTQVNLGVKLIKPFM